MQNWKTTVGGIAGGIAAIGTGITLCIAGNYGAGAGAIATGLAMFWTGIHAKDS